jgi:hypothetical protein
MLKYFSLEHARDLRIISLTEKKKKKYRGRRIPLPKGNTRPEQLAFHN